MPVYSGWQPFGAFCTRDKRQHAFSELNEPPRATWLSWAGWRSREPQGNHGGPAIEDLGIVDRVGCRAGTAQMGTYSSPGHQNVRLGCNRRPRPFAAVRPEVSELRCIMPVGGNVNQRGSLLVLTPLRTTTTLPLASVDSQALHLRIPTDQQNIFVPRTSAVSFCNNRPPSGIARTPWFGRTPP